MELTRRRVAEATRQVEARIADTVASSPSGFPHFADPVTGTWTTTVDGDWTGGHWTGAVWLAALDDSRLRRSAEAWCLRLGPRASCRTVFRGFLYYYGAALGEILHGSDLARQVAVAGAEQLLKSFNDSAGIVPLGESAEEADQVGDGETSIDAVGAIVGLFCWATRITGDRAYRAAAVRHGLRHIDICVRPDGSVCQSASFDQQSGEVLRRYTHKGHAQDSTWARAQAWGMLAFTLAAKWLPEEPRFRTTAAKVADWWLAHVPDDSVAYWDFDVRQGHPTERDTSATAIAASSLLTLSAITHNAEYRLAGERTMSALVDGYLVLREVAGSGAPAASLTAGCYNHRLGIATHHELIWGTYYLLEALQFLGASCSRS